MTLTPAEWKIVCTLLALAVSIIAFFLKRTMNTTDNHDKDITNIKLTYATKQELKENKDELRDENKALTNDVSEIKSNYLTKDEYIRKQVETDRKLDRIYELLINDKGGSSNG